MQEWDTLRERMQGATTYLELTAVKEALDRLVEARRRAKAHIELALADTEGERAIRVQQAEGPDAADAIAISLEGEGFVLTVRMGAAAARALAAQLDAVVRGASVAPTNVAQTGQAPASTGEGDDRGEWDSVAPQ